MNNTSNVILNWKPLQHYEHLGKVDKTHLGLNRAGLYVWGFMDDAQKFWPYYIGKHRNVPFRLCEHLSNLKGGNYRIYGIDDLFKLEGSQYYDPRLLQDRVSFIRDSFTTNQVGNVQNMIDRFHFTYCIMERFTEFGALAESTVLNLFPKEILINTRIGRPSDLIDIGNLFSEGIISSEWDKRQQRQIEML